LARVESRCKSEWIYRLGASSSVHARVCQRRYADDVIHPGKVDTVKEIERLDDSFYSILRIGAGPQLFGQTQIDADIDGSTAGVAAREGRTVRVRLRIVVRIKTEQ